MLGPFLNDLVSKYPDVKFYKVDTTHEPLEAHVAELGVKALPAFKFYKVRGALQLYVFSQVISAFFLVVALTHQLGCLRSYICTLGRMLTSCTTTPTFHTAERKGGR